MGPFAFTVDVLQDFVIGTDFLFVFLDNAIYPIDRGITSKLFEFCVDAEVQNIRIEYTVVSHAESALVVLVWLTFADAVRKLPGVALFSVGLSYRSLLGFLDSFVEADVDKAFLLEKGFVDVGAHFFGARFDTEACLGLDQNTARWKLTPLHQLLEVLVQLRAMLGIGNFSDVLAQKSFKFVLLHSFGERL